MSVQPIGQYDRPQVIVVTTNDRSDLNDFNACAKSGRLSPSSRRRLASQFTAIVGKGAQPVKPRKRIAGRNDPCPCKSGKKFKKCCLRKPRTP